MVSNERVLKELALEEGIRYTTYRCTAGYLTIGIGHNLDAEPIDHLIGRKLSLNPRLTKSELILVFNHDVEKVKRQLDQHLPWWRGCPSFAQYVLISLCFNMGIGGLVRRNPPKYNGLRGFVNTLKRFEAHDWNGAARGLENAKWYRQVGNRGPKICNILRYQRFPDGLKE